MSVKACNREVSQMEFLKNARDIEVFFIKMMVTRPKKYRAFYQKIVESSMEILNCSKRGNSIYVERREDVLLRTEQFKKALAELQALISQIEVIYYLFNDEGISSKQIEEITKMINTEIGLLKGLLKSDRVRYKNLLKETDITSDTSN